MFKRYVFCEGLTSLLGSNGKFLINVNGQVKDEMGNDIPYHRDDIGNKIVHCLGWDGERDYRIIDLVAVQFKSLYIPKETYGKVIAFTIDGNSDNTHASNIGYRFKGGRLQYEPKPGYYYVPGYTSTAINNLGKCISVISGEERSFYITNPDHKRKIKGGYAFYNVVFSPGIYKTISRHRALCLVFMEYPDNVDAMTVNHINGIPGDDRLENLEWATRGQNNIHAYVNDLKSQHMRVLVRDVISGRVDEYYSISECSRALGWTTDETIRQRLKSSSFGQVFQDGTQLKLKSDSRDWIIPDNPEEAVKAAQQARPLMVRNCATGEILNFDKVSNAGKTLGINDATITYRLKEDNRSPLFGYQFKDADDDRDFPKFSDEEYQKSLVPNSFEVNVRNLLTGETRTYESARQAAKGIGNRHIFNELTNGKHLLTEDGWQCKFSYQPWVDIEDFEEVLYKQKREVMCRDEKTGTVVIASNALNLAEILKLDSKAIRTAAFTRGNKLYHGYRFRLGVSNEPWPETNSLAS